jgi:hypothetical protein
LFLVVLSSSLSLGREAATRLGSPAASWFWNSAIKRCQQLAFLKLNIDNAKVKDMMLMKT